ncbi:hypothetical protein RJT34_03104 [Clitoria ternatea]|uniref:Uncharacterized protein n=1 Tax=Clitoria ternatea TaxID=43366 RepID=A0AAN9KJQ7_CLITE
MQETFPHIFMIFTDRLNLYLSSITIDDFTLCHLFLFNLTGLHSWKQNSLIVMSRLHFATITCLTLAFTASPLLFFFFPHALSAPTLNQFQDSI